MNDYLLHKLSTVTGVKATYSCEWSNGNFIWKVIILS